MKSRTVWMLASMAVAVLWAVPALAEHAGESGESAVVEGPAGEVEEGDEGRGHRIGLPAEAINWTNFDYQSSEYEEQMASYGVHHPGAPMIAVFFNFVLLVLLVYLAARKPVGSLLKARSDGVREALAEAAKMLEEANERLADYSARLERMDEEMSRLREEFIAAGQRERDRLIADAGAKAERMRREAEIRLEQEFSQLREELRVEMVEKAVDAATGVLKREVKETDQRRLAEEYLRQVEQGGLGR